MHVEAYHKKAAQDHDKAVWLLWHGEYLTRVKKMPPMKELMSSANKAELKKIDQDVIIGRLKAYQKEHSKVKGGANGSSS